MRNAGCLQFKIYFINASPKYKPIKNIKFDLLILSFRKPRFSILQNVLSALSPVYFKITSTSELLPQSQETVP